MKKILPVCVLILSFMSLFLVPVAQSPIHQTRASTIATGTNTVNPANPSNPNGIVAKFLGQNHQVISGTPPFACYNVQVSLNLTSYLPTTSRFIMPDFLLYESGANLQVQNQLYYAYANNTISQVVLFPSNPIVLIVTFQNLCLMPVAANLHVWLAYDDSVNFYQTQVF